MLRPKWIREETLKRVLHCAYIAAEWCGVPLLPLLRFLPPTHLPPSRLIPEILAIVVAIALFTTTAPHSLHGISEVRLGLPRHLSWCSFPPLPENIWVVQSLFPRLFALLKWSLSSLFA